jgi:hypothetical protein
MRSKKGVHEVRAAREDAGRRLAAGAGILLLLIGLALFFVANPPS